MQVVMCNDSLFLFIVERYFMVWRYHSLFNQPPVEGHLGCFQFGAIMNKAAINIYAQFFCVNISFHFSHRSTSAGSYGKCILSFLGNCQTIFQGDCIILHLPPTTTLEG